MASEFKKKMCGKNRSFDEGFCLLEKSEDLIDDFLHGRKSFMKEMKVKNHLMNPCVSIEKYEISPRDPFIMN